MQYEMEDDFDRFCRIGKGSISGPSNSSQKRDLLSAPSPMCRARAGSLRENHSRHQRLHRSPRGSVHRQTSSDYRRHSLTPSVQDISKFGVMMPSKHNEFLQEPRSRSPRSNNLRSMSFQPMASLFPGNCYPEAPPGDTVNIVRVRSFRRTKNGVISDGDRLEFANENVGERRRDGQSSPNGESNSTHHLGKPRSLKLPGGMHDRVEVASAIRKKSCSGTLCSSAEPSSDGDYQSSRGQQYTVQVLGAAQVGKTTMCTQFLSSESLEDGFDSGKLFDIKLI